MNRKRNGGQANQENIYALSDRGMAVLRDYYKHHQTETDLYQKNQQIGSYHLYHDRGLTQLWAVIKCAIDDKRKETKQQYSLSFWLQDQPDREQLKAVIKVPVIDKRTKEITGQQDQTLIPDIVCKIQTPQTQQLWIIEYYLTKTTSHQKFLDKLKLYHLYCRQGKQKKYRAKNIRVLTVIQTGAIRDYLIDLIQTKNKNSSLVNSMFWFVAEEDYRLYRKEKVKGKDWFRKIDEAKSILEPIFKTPTDDKWHSLEE